MSLSKLQERLERSLFEVIRLVCVAEGYTPDIADTNRYPDTGSVAATNWAEDLSQINAEKGFSIEVMGNTQTRGTKTAPRINIITRRAMAGDIGAPFEGTTLDHPTDPNKFAKMSVPFESSRFAIDVHVVYASAAQERVLNGIMAKAIGLKKFIPYYDNAGDRFLSVMVNQFDYPDPLDELGEKAYTYEIPDVFDYDTNDFVPIAKINEITTELETIEPNESLNSSLNTLIAEAENTGKVIVNSSTINYQ